MGNSDQALQNDVRTDNGVMKRIQIFMPLTRKWRVPKIAEMLWKLDYGDHECELLVCIDNKDISPAYIDNEFQKWEMPFRIKIIETGKYPAAEVNLSTRRNRIVDMLEFSKQYIGDTDFVFMVEDDTEIAQNALVNLLADYENLTKAGAKVGFVEGAQVGRHGYRMIGAWRLDDLENPTVVQTIPFTRKALLEKIDGGGLYCFITPTHLFKAHKWHWEHECFSVDATYGFDLRKAGYQNFIDWSVEAGHVQQDAAALYPNEDCVVVRYEQAPEGHWLIQNKGKEGYIS